MAESTLSLVKDDLEGEIGLFLGWGRGAANAEQTWDTRQQSAIVSARKSGERQFYHPALEGLPYVWSFLRPVATMTLPTGVSILPMPDDFGGIEGEITASSATGTLWETVPLIADVRPHYAANPSQTGRPRLAAVEPLKGAMMSRGTRHQLYVFPTPDQAYTLQLAYYIHPDAMSGQRPYAVGGPQHAETLLAACIAAAELYQDDMRGPRWEYFQERLQASVNMDRRLKPQLLGYNRDRSDLRETGCYGRPGRWWGDTAAITYFGVGH